MSDGEGQIQSNHDHDQPGYTGHTSVTAHGNSPEAYVSRYALRRTVAEGGDTIEWSVSEDGERVIGTIVKGGDDA